MTANLRRALAVGLTATLAFLGLLTVPAHSAPTSTPTSCAGVWEVVQSDETKPSTAQIECAKSYSSGVVALQSAGFVPTGTSFITQIDGLPTNPDYNTNGNLWWSYWHALVNPDGTIGTWSQYTVGADASTPVKGEVEGWLLTVPGANGPAVTRVFTPAASASASSTSASSSASASSTAASSSASASTSTPAATAAAPSTSAVQSPAVLKAAGYLSANLPTTDDGAGAFVSAILALSATRSCAYSPTLSALVTSLGQQAADYVGTDPARAANLTIAAIAVGADPTSFGGLNLLSILAAGTGVPQPTAPGQALVIELPATSSRPLAAYRLDDLTGGAS